MDKMRKLNKTLTQNEVKKLFIYEPETGNLIRRKSTGGQLVGTIINNFDDCGYITMKVYGVKCKGHRIIWLYMTGQFPIELIDHIDRNRSNNKWENLREASNSQNQQNKNIQINNNTGYIGVSYHKRDNKYSARCSVNNKTHNLGNYNTALEASIVYEKFAKENYGEFYRDNIANGSLDTFCNS